MVLGMFFFFNDTATTEIYTLSLHDALPISPLCPRRLLRPASPSAAIEVPQRRTVLGSGTAETGSGVIVPVNKPSAVKVSPVTNAVVSFASSPALASIPRTLKQFRPPGPKLKATPECAAPSDNPLQSNRSNTLLPTAGKTTEAKLGSPWPMAKS